MDDTDQSLIKSMLSESQKPDEANEQVDQEPNVKPVRVQREHRGKERAKKSPNKPDRREKKTERKSSKRK